MQNEYKTKDLAEAGVLVTKGKKLLRIERESGICFFVFQDKSGCEELSDRFFFGDLEVNAREYKNAMDTLKNRIFAGE